MAGRDKCLKRQLLFASVQAYHPHPPYYGVLPDWRDPPREIDSGIDFALAGLLGQDIVIAFRGTLLPIDLKPDLKELRLRIPDPLVIADWLNNLHARRHVGARVGAGTATAATIPGGVHLGFAASLTNLWPDVATAIDRLRDGNDAPRLYFTGHSKGGALANLAASCARQVWPNAVVKAVTMGAPRVGDVAFANAYADARIECIRYEVAKDLVPTVPETGLSFLPSISGYLPVGRHCPVALVTYSEPRFSLPFRPRDDRWLIDERIAAHLPYRGFGYGDHVCEPGCQHDWR